MEKKYPIIKKKDHEWEKAEQALRLSLLKAKEKLSKRQLIQFLVIAKEYLNTLEEDLQDEAELVDTLRMAYNLIGEHHSIGGFCDVCHTGDVEKLEKIVIILKKYNKDPE